MYHLTLVKSGRELKRFVRMPEKLYKQELNDSNYVQPLNVFIKLLLGNYRSLDRRLLLVSKNGVDVARVGFKIHKSHSGEKLHFGFFECYPQELEAAKLMFDWAREQFHRLDIIGPYHFRMEDPFTGILLSGFDSKPYFLMPYNPSYYPSFLTQCGLNTAMEVIAYDVSAHRPLPLDMESKALDCEKEGFSIRWMTKKSLKNDAIIIAKIFNDALSSNWGFEEITREQIQEMHLMFKFFIDERVVSFVMKDGKEVGCLIMLPNFNPLISKSNGKLSLPLIFNILFKKKSLSSIRGYALGILKEFHGKSLGTYLVHKTWAKGYSLGYHQAEISWILSDNIAMNSLTLKVGGEPNRRYGIFEYVKKKN